MKQVYCTYCSARKRKDLVPLAAIERYESRRISRIYTESCSRGISFLILSGAFGMVTAHDEIPSYDHLLTHEEVHDMASRVTDQLIGKGIEELVFFTVDPSVDAQVLPYHNTMALACEKAGVVFSVRVLTGNISD